jgi:hypothetical protein
MTRENSGKEHTGEVMIDPPGANGILVGCRT